MKTQSHHYNSKGKFIKKKEIEGSNALLIIEKYIYIPKQYIDTKCIYEY